MSERADTAANLDTSGPAPEEVFKPCIFIISAPSGSGKSTLVDRLLKDLGGLRFSVSYTTRNPRGNEENGREYYFVSRDEFEAMIEHGDLLEWAEVFGNYYGTARRFLDEARRLGEDLLLDIDVQGAKKVRERLPEAVSIFILPPSRVEMESRLRKRGQDSEEVIAKRLRDAQREIRDVGHYDYVLINDQLERSAECLRAIVLSERIRRRSGNEIPDVAALAAGCRTAAQMQRVTPIIEGFQR